MEDREIIDADCLNIIGNGVTPLSLVSLYSAACCTNIDKVLVDGHEPEVAGAVFLSDALLAEDEDSR